MENEKLSENLQIRCDEPDLNPENSLRRTSVHHRYDVYSLSVLGRIINILILTFATSRHFLTHRNGRVSALQEDIVSPIIDYDSASANE
jgi:hypothetical protein